MYTTDGKTGGETSSLGSCEIAFVPRGSERAVRERTSSRRRTEQVREEREGTERVDKKVRVAHTSTHARARAHTLGQTHTEERTSDLCASDHLPMTHPTTKIEPKSCKNQRGMEKSPHLYVPDHSPTRGPPTQDQILAGSGCLKSSQSSSHQQAS